jgi:hypothetical protein
MEEEEVSEKRSWRRSSYIRNCQHTEKQFLSWFEFFILF